MLRLASFAASLSSPLRGFLWGVIIPLPTFPLSAIHPEGSIPSSSPEASRAATSCMDPGQGSEARTSLPPGRTRIRVVHVGRPVLTATTIRGDCAGSSRGRGCRPPRKSQPSGTSSAMSSMSFRAPDDRIGHGLDGPRDRELGHTELFADHRLRNVVVHVDQHHLQAFFSPMLGGTPRPPPRADG